MHGMLVIYRKELSDHFSNYRFLILFSLICMVSFITAYMAAMGLRDSLEGVPRPRFVFLLMFNTSGTLFSLVQFTAFFGPLAGLLLGFDAVNRERAGGTLIKLMSQPISRDAVINGKFLAGITTIAIMLVSVVLMVSGLGLTLLGIVPGVEEIMRLALYLFLSILYISFWLGLAILFSILFRSVTTSALASMAFWVFLSFFIYVGADVIADALYPVKRVQDAGRETLIRNARMKESISLFSPMVLYSRTANILMDPFQKTTRTLILMGQRERISAGRFQNPLPPGQSLLVVFPHLAVLTAATLTCFGISYAVFLAQEIRS